MKTGRCEVELGCGMGRERKREEGEGREERGEKGEEREERRGRKEGRGEGHKLCDVWDLFFSDI